MEFCRNILEAEYPTFQQIMLEYLPDSPVKFVAEMFDKYAQAYVGYFMEHQLVGICFGWPRYEQVKNDDSFTVNGIAIATPFNAAGRGKKLISYFEDMVRKLGFNRVTIGSADGYVEKFYMQNGYRPIEYKVLIDGCQPHVHKINSDDEYKNLDRRQIKNNVGGDYGFIVFNKNL